jgi:two-component system, NtrC family, response regulator HydG
MGRQKLEAYWETVVDTIMDGVMIVNPEGRIVYVNRALEEITGYPKADMEGQSCHFLSCSACEMVRRTEDGHWCAMFQQGSLRKQKCRIRRKDGGIVHAVKNASIIRDPMDQVLGAVETITDVTDLTRHREQIETYRRELIARDRFYGMIGASPAMRRLFDMIVNASRSDAPVIVFGESGTGKELVAHAVHQRGHRSKKPFVQVNCAALNESLLESELFGHVKGSFTGAHCSRTGRFEAAQGGDIFLDEIGDLPMATQVKLLRVLEEKEVERVGDHRPIPVDVRIISATHRDLADLVSRGQFREDFFYRINVIPIHVPPLRERSEDIPLLARSFFNRIQVKSGKPIEGISGRAMARLTDYPWPGNVRELRSAMEYAFVTAQEGLIEPEHLPVSIIEQARTRPAVEKPMRDLDQLKKERLVNALMEARGNQSAAARLLGMSRTSVWNQVKRYRMNPEEFKK